MEHAFSIAEFIAVLCAFTQWLLFDKVIVCSGGLESECARANSEAKTTTTSIQHPQRRRWCEEVES